MGINDLIKSGKQTPVRRMWVKRRYVDGTYEADWFRADYLSGQDRVLDWGSFSLEIDFQPGEIGNFETSGLTLSMDNQDGHFNYESDPQSIFYPEYTYINRRYSKIKIDTGYLDEDNETEVGVETVFEGVIERVAVSESQVATINALPYTAILKSYLVIDLALTGSMTVSAVVTAIMNQSKITDFIPYVAPTNTLNPTITDASLLEGNYWDVLKQLAQQANAVPLLDGSAWAFKDRTAGSVVWAFLGAGQELPDIESVLSYDDEGADKVRLFWQVEGTSVTAESSDTILKTKYLNSPQIISLTDYDTSEQQSIVNALLAQWETPRPTISFQTKFMVNIISLLDKITMKISGPVYPLDTPKWGMGQKWGDGSVWGKARGSVNISAGIEWKVIRILKDIENWSFEIHSEKVA